MPSMDDLLVIIQVIGGAILIGAALYKLYGFAFAIRQGNLESINTTLKERISFLEAKLLDLEKINATFKADKLALEKEVFDLKKQLARANQEAANYQAQASAKRRYLKCLVCGNLHLKFLQRQATQIVNMSATREKLEEWPLPDPILHYRCEKCSTQRSVKESEMKILEIAPKNQSGML